MKRFYIKELSASGEKVEYSSISFHDGVNIIYGPSNTGKSYIISCINFIFGGDIPFTKASTGYDTISALLELSDGGSISLTRKIIDGRSGETGAGKVEVVSNAQEIISGSYGIRNGDFNDLLLDLIGIEKEHRIISTEDFDTARLTFRSMLHLFFLEEEYIFRKSTAWNTPKMGKINASLSIIRFLLTGDDLMDTIPKETPDERERKITERAGVLIYLNQKIREMQEKKEQLQQRDDISEEDVEKKLNEILRQMDEVQKQITEATTKSQDLLKEVYQVSTELEEARFMKDRYRALASQYSSDLKRLDFIRDGKRKDKKIVPPTACPFCGQTLEKVPEVEESYLEVSGVERAKIEMQIVDLQKVAAKNDAKIERLQNKIQELNKQNQYCINLIHKQLKPVEADLKNKMNVFQGIINAQKELYAIESMTTELNTDAFNKEQEEEESAQKYNGRASLSQETWKALSDSLNQMIKDCGYPGAPESRLNIDTVDVVVGAKFKKDEGKGYRAFLNAIMLLNLMKYFEKNAKYAPHLLILDSPILSLKEAKYKISKKEASTTGMRKSLFQYMVDHCGENQIIIAENEIPEDVDYKDSFIQEFTMDETTGRYGFLESVR